MVEKNGPSRKREPRDGQGGPRKEPSEVQAASAAPPLERRKPGQPKGSGKKRTAPVGQSDADMAPVESMSADDVETFQCQIDEAQLRSLLTAVRIWATAAKMPAPAVPFCLRCVAQAIEEQCKAAKMKVVKAERVPKPTVHVDN